MLGLYFHVPFCEKKCAYCNFYSVCFNSSLQKKYFDAIFYEIEKRSFKDELVNSIYFGGGTPSLVDPSNLKQTINLIKKFFKLANDCEITIEINPNTIDEESLLKYLEIGINRLSFGVQSFDDFELKILERSHDKKTSLNIINTAKTLGFSNISIDLIIGIPFQTKKSLIETLNAAVDLNISHISIYQLKIEPKTKFFKNPPKNLPSNDSVAEFYLICCEKLKQHNFSQYEISNFAKDGKKSRHNLKYWEMEPYLGFGPSAHSFFQNKRFFHSDSLEQYIKNPCFCLEEKTNFDFEWFILRLRLTQGIKLEELKQKKIWNANFERKIKKLEENKLVSLEKNNLSLTKKGMLLQNSIILHLTQNSNSF